jgi:hypothetical protein
MHSGDMQVRISRQGRKACIGDMARYANPFLKPPPPDIQKPYIKDNIDKVQD